MLLSCLLSLFTPIDSFCLFVQNTCVRCVMEQFTTEQRVLIVKTFYQNGESATQTVRTLRTNLGRNEAPNESTVRRLMTKFQTTGSVATAKPPGRNRSRRTEQQIAVVRDSVTLSPGKSIRRRSQQLGIPTTSLHRILHKDHHMSAYKIQLTHIFSHLTTGGVCNLLTGLWRDLQPTKSLQRKSSSVTRPTST
jgi:hypothetical protein